MPTIKNAASSVSLVSIDVRINRFGGRIKLI
jgi:hypothetical protein